MLHHEPRRFGAISSYQRGTRPTMFVHDRTEPFGVLPVHKFHARMIPAVEPSGLRQFVAHAEVFLAHGDEFAAKRFVQHRVYSGSASLPG